MKLCAIWSMLLYSIISRVRRNLREAGMRRNLREVGNRSGHLCVKSGITSYTGVTVATTQPRKEVMSTVPVYPRVRSAMPRNPGSVFKRHPKVFYGTQRHMLSPDGSSSRSSNDQAEAVRKKPVAVETASGKKLAISSTYTSSSEPSGRLRSASNPCTSTGEPGESYDYVGRLKGYRLVGCDKLSQAVSEVGVCSVCCSPLMLGEDLVTRRGMVSKLVIGCTNTACNKEAEISNPYSSDAKTLNARSVMGMRAIRRGQASLETFCIFLDMLPPMGPRSYSEHNQTLAMFSMEVATENMCAASAHLHELRGVGPTEVIDVAVTCDGTWSKRGFTATHGAVMVISWESGQVLDFEIKSKHCSVCARNKMDEQSEEFAEWWDGHQAVCEANHAGSSPAMECNAAVDIWRRLEETLHLRYTEIICDGDS